MIAVRLFAALLAAVALAAPASAAEISVFCAGAVQATVTALAADYERTSRDHVAFTFGTVGMLRDALAQGKHADVVLLSSAGLDALQDGGALAPGTRVALGRTGVGVAVRTGAPLPDISSTEAFRRALVAAKSVTYADPAKGATSGKVVETVFERLGIAPEMLAKATKTPGGFSAQLVADGKAEMSLQNISELVPVAGVTVVGPFPPELQTYTVYGAAVTAGATDASSARAFVGALAAPAAAPRWRAAGFETVSAARPTP